MIGDAPLQQFREQGYFTLPNLFAPAALDALVERIDAFADAHNRELQERGQQGISRPNEITFTAHLAARDPAIMAFVKQAKLVELATAILGPDVVLYWDQAVYKKPETRRDFPWHQDNGYIAVEPQQYLTCWIALADATVENGCVWVLPGSHRNGVVAHTDTPIGKQCYFGDDPGVPVPLTKGGAAIFSSLLFHRSGPNLSDGVRKGYIVQYAPLGVRNAVSGEILDRVVVARDGRPVSG